MKKIILALLLCSGFLFAQDLNPQKRLNFSSNQKVSNKNERLSIVRSRHKRQLEKNNKSSLENYEEEKKSSLLCESEEDFKAGKCKILTSSAKKKAPNKKNTIKIGR